MGLLGGEEGDENDPWPTCCKIGIRVERVSTSTVTVMLKYIVETF